MALSSIFLAVHAVSAATGQDGERTFRVPFSDVKALKEAGDGVQLYFGEMNVLLIRIDERRIVALDPTCTHKGCPVDYVKEWGEIRCSCYGSTYDIEGHVTANPAHYNLRKFPLTVSRNGLIITLPRKTPPPKRGF